jgi:hypothetical protein
MSNQLLTVAMKSMYVVLVPQHLACSNLHFPILHRDFRCRWADKVTPRGGSFEDGRLELGEASQEEGLE